MIFSVPFYFILWGMYSGGICGIFVRLGLVSTCSDCLSDAQIHGRGLEGLSDAWIGDPRLSNAYVGSQMLPLELQTL